MVLDSGSGEPQAASLGQSRRAGPICSVGKMGCGSQVRSRYSVFSSRKCWGALLQRSRGNPSRGLSLASSEAGAPS